MGYAIAIVIGIIGAYLIISDLRSAKLKSRSTEAFSKVASALHGEEKNLYDLVASSDGGMFQSDLVEKSGLQKVKVSRVLDHLEAQGPKAPRAQVPDKREPCGMFLGF